LVMVRVRWTVGMADRNLRVDSGPPPVRVRVKVRG